MRVSFCRHNQSADTARHRCPTGYLARMYTRYVESFVLLKRKTRQSAQ
jgi:hypothetical protein